jgi:hypothetical protein
MAEQAGRAKEQGSRRDDTFKRHGPEPPENDSGPSASEVVPQSGIEESGRDEARKHPVRDFARD